MRVRNAFGMGVLLVLLAAQPYAQPRVHVSVEPQAKVKVRPRIDVSVTADFNELNDYGEWIYLPGLGTVWQPYADPDWRPFMYGHWVWSSDGWMWSSYEPFGWIVCHYGYWHIDDDWGWVWVPGYDWSPARVEWYVTDYEVGWAPMFPPSRPGFVVRRHPHFVFVPTHSFTSVEIHPHVSVRVRPARSAPNVVVHKGPPKLQFVKRSARAPVVHVKPNKVRVTAGKKKPLYRVEVKSGPARPKVAVPVGKNYRQKVRVHSPAGPAAAPDKPKHGPTHVSPAPHKKTITVTKPAHHSSKPGPKAVKKTTVKTEQENEEEQEEEEDKQEKTKVKVKVKTR